MASYPLVLTWYYPHRRLLADRNVRPSVRWPNKPLRPPSRWVSHLRTRPNRACSRVSQGPGRTARQWSLDGNRTDMAKSGIGSNESHRKGTRERSWNWTPNSRGSSAGLTSWACCEGSYVPLFRRGRPWTAYWTFQSSFRFPFTVSAPQPTTGERWRLRVCGRCGFHFSATARLLAAPVLKLPRTRPGPAIAHGHGAVHVSGRNEADEAPYKAMVTPGVVRLGLGHVGSHGRPELGPGCAYGTGIDRCSFKAGSFIHAWFSIS